MKINKCEKTNACTYELELVLDGEKIGEAVSKVYRRDSKKFTVPGFRKGRAPRNLIEKMYGEDIFHLDAVNEVFPEAYEAALEEKNLEAVDRPDAEILSISLVDGAVVKVIVTVKPEVQIGKYKGLKATKTIHPIDESRIDAEISRMQERNARLLNREDAAKDGDTATIDYDGYVDGVAFAGGKDEGHKLELGSGQFIPGFEEQVVGRKAGESFDVTVTFPKEYHAGELSGKEAIFKVALHEVQYKEMPKLDDEFAKDVSEFDTMKELKQSLRDLQQKELDDQAEIEVENAIVDQIVETLKGEIPSAMFETKIDDMVQDFAYRLQQQGLDIKTYLKYTGMDMAAFRAGFKDKAEKQVKMRLAMEEIARLEKIEATQEEIGEEIKKLSVRYEMEEEKTREMIQEKELAGDVKLNKALEFLKEQSIIKEEKAKKEEKVKEKK